MTTGGDLHGQLQRHPDGRVVGVEPEKHARPEERPAYPKMVTAASGERVKVHNEQEEHEAQSQVGADHPGAEPQPSSDEPQSHEEGFMNAGHGSLDLSSDNPEEDAAGGKRKKK